MLQTGRREADEEGYTERGWTIHTKIEREKDRKTKTDGQRDRKII